jgi:hypothetical protein
MTRENPTTAEIRNWATYVPDTSIGMHVSEQDAAAFDRWLAAHDREVAAKALRDVADEFFASLPDGTPNGRAYNSYRVAWMLRERADLIEATP